jgi:hypothetical protein
MLLLEVALQGVRGLPPLVRLQLKPGLNVITTSDAQARSAVIDGVYHTLHADAAGREILSTLQGAPPSRTSITLQGRDNKTYRLVRDLVSGGVRLMKHVEAERFDNVTQDPAEAARFLRAQLQLPSEVVYERLFLVSPDSLALRGAEARSRRRSPLYPPRSQISPSAPGMAQPSGFEAGGMNSLMRPPSPAWAFDDQASPMGPVLNAGFAGPGGPATPNQGAQPMLPPSALRSMPPPAVTPESRIADLAAKRAEHDRLRHLLEARKNSRAGHQELDQLIKRREALKPIVIRRSELEAQMEELTARAEAQGDIAAMPADMDERLKDFDTAKERRELDLKRLGEERNEAHRAIEMEPPALWKDRYFQAGLGMAVASVSLAIAFERPGLALMNILGTLVAGAAALHHVNELERHNKLGARIGLLKDREVKIEKQFEMETVVARKLMQQYGVTNIQELLGRLEEVKAVRLELDQTSRELLAMDSDPNVVAAVRDLARVERRIEELEAHMMSLETGDHSGTTEDLVHRVEGLANELRQAGIDPGVIRSAVRRAPVTSAELVDEEEDEDGYGSGYGGGGGRPAKPSSGRSAAPYYSASPSSGGGFGGGMPTGYSSGGKSQLDATICLLDSFAELFHFPVEQLGPRLSERLSQYLIALTDGYYNMGTFGVSGEIGVVGPGSNEDEIAFHQVPEDRILAVEAALRFTLLEQASRKASVPVLIDDPMVMFAERHRKVFLKTLRYLSQVTQVIVLTSKDDVTEGHRVGW